MAEAFATLICTLFWYSTMRRWGCGWNRDRWETHQYLLWGLLWNMIFESSFHLRENRTSLPNWLLPLLWQYIPILVQTTFLRWHVSLTFFFLFFFPLNGTGNIGKNKIFLFLFLIAVVTWTKNNSSTMIKISVRF